MFSFNLSLQKIHQKKSSKYFELIYNGDIIGLLKMNSSFFFKKI